MAAPPPAPGQDAVMTVTGSVQKYVTKKKKVLTAEEAELHELAQAAGIILDQEVFKIIVDLLKMNVAPLAVFQMLKSMCAGHRLTDPVTAEANPAAALATHPEARAGRNKLNPPTTTSQGPAERSSREGSGQRVPRQSSASRMQKSSSSGKSSGGSST
ncbi:mitotic-spindle organizing protein 2B isoform X1 [Dendropsophus ebraccatus]|uniref:mitotic-spindle organizing protein 2B isoform X1 n=1 Tax=Dendropsophus ebraccatus TaxID=150705 RepID=UPI003831CFA8